MRSLYRTFLAVALFAMGAAAATTVRGTIADAGGNLLSGSCTFQTVAPFTAGVNGWRVVGVPFTVYFTRGDFVASLIPTDSAVPSGQYYRVNCSARSVAGTPKTWGPEIWLVPTSATDLTIRDVVVVDAGQRDVYSINWSQLAQNGAQPGQAPMWSGTAWVPGSVNGDIPYTSAPQDGQYIRWDAAQRAWHPVTFVDQETITGAIDGVNVTFALANAPNPPAGLVLFRNGVAQRAGQDYTVSGNTITFVAAATPQPDDTLIAWYRY